MRMIFTNKNQRPPRYDLKAAEVKDLIDSIVDDPDETIDESRIRQIARGYNSCGDPIGWVYFSAKCPPDGAYQFPFKKDHVYTQEEVLEAIATMKRIHEKDPRYKVHSLRYYCKKDIPLLIARSKKLKKNIAVSKPVVLPAQAPSRKRIAS